MDNLLRGVGCLILLAVGVVWFSGASIGIAGVGITLGSGVIGLIVGALIIGSVIGIAGGGDGIGGGCVFGILFAIIFALLANSGMLTMSSWVKQSSNEQQSVLATATIVPTSQAVNTTTITASISTEIFSISYGEIEDSYATMNRSEWKQYKRNLIGKRVRWSGVVDQKSDDSVNIYMGQNKLLRRIYLADLPTSTVAALKEHQAVEFEGTIYEISQILGLNLYLTDVSFTSARTEAVP
ncbi:MAG: hypothetical protein R3E79_18435 [Caldilineaceae bacterium]